MSIRAAAHLIIVQARVFPPQQPLGLSLLINIYIIAYLAPAASRVFESYMHSITPESRRLLVNVAFFGCAT